MILIELDYISAAGLFAVLVILAVGFYRRQRARCRQLQPALTANVSTEQTAIDNHVEDSDIKPTNGLLQQQQQQQQRSPKPSTDDESSVRRRRGFQNGPLTATSTSASAGVCSGCQCSMKLCRCTIVLYRPSSASRERSPADPNGSVTPSPSSFRSGDFTRFGYAEKSPPEVSASSGRRSPSADRKRSTPTQPPPEVVADRYLAPPRGRSRSPRRRADVTAATSGTGAGGVASAKVGAEVNANVIGCKNMMK